MFEFGDTAEEEDEADDTYSVGDLADAINVALERGFSGGIWVHGEISGWNGRGTHAYFTLVDDSDERRKGRDKAVVSVSFFANVRARLRPQLQRHRLELADGMKVRIFGYVNFYAPNGRLGLKMNKIDPRYTLGGIAQSREEVLRRLAADGLLEANGRIVLSPIPLRVGAVTSVGTAAWHDFHDELQRSPFGFQLTVVDTQVQGDSAERMVAAAISTLSRRSDLDVIVVIRGGGARNELAVFDDEGIARAIATATTPVLTGIGHEVDRSIADEVAHTSLKTPTACAGALITSARRYTEATEATWTAILARGDISLSNASNALSESAHRIAGRTNTAVERADERLNSRIQRLAQLGLTATERCATEIDTNAERLLVRADSTIDRARARLDLRGAQIAALDPAVQLARGWSVTRFVSGAVLRSVADIAAGATITTLLVDGTVTSTVAEIRRADRDRSDRDQSGADNSSADQSDVGRDNTDHPDIEKERTT